MVTVSIHNNDTFETPIFPSGQRFPSGSGTFTPPNPKQVLQTLIHARNPSSSGYIQPTSVNSVQKQMVRQRIVKLHNQNRMADNQAAIFGGNVPPGNPNSAMMSMPPGIVHR